MSFLNNGAQTCRYCLSNSPHPLFAYLISDRVSGQEQISSSIGISRHPFMRLNQHNRVEGFTVVGAKHTKCSEGNWRIEMVIGPFFTKGAKKFKEEWRSAARTLTNRITIGIRKAMQQKQQHLSVHISDAKFVWESIRENSKAVNWTH